MIFSCTLICVEWKKLFSFMETILLVLDLCFYMYPYLLEDERLLLKRKKRGKNLSFLIPCI